MAWMRALLARRRTERGAELIEMAIVTPVLLMILAGIFDFGFLFRSWQVVTNAAREGARVGILPSFRCEPGAGGASSDVQARVDAYLTASGISSTTNLYNIDVELVPVDTGAGTIQACVVRVELFQRLPSLSAIGRFFGGAFSSIRVTGGAVMRTESPILP